MLTDEERQRGADALLPRAERQLKPIRSSAARRTSELVDA
jgi:hypothetical protein